MAHWRTWILLSAGAVACGALLVLAAQGGTGQLVVCGADRAVVCVVWPLALATLAWLCVVLPLAVLAVWQVVLWRGSGERRADGAGQERSGSPAPER